MNIVEIKGLSKFYETNEALKNVNLQIPPGQVVGLLGPNGSGKTTLIKILTGLITDYNGSVSIDGYAPSPTTCSLVSYLPDRTVLPAWLKIQDAVEMYQSFYPDFDAVKALKLLGSMEIDPRPKIKTLSKGMTERLHLALVMSRKARLYILDEPIASVDPAARDFIIDTIINNYTEDSSILMSTHIINDVEPVVDRVVFLKKGEIILDEEADSVRERTGLSVDQLFKEEFKC